MMEVLFSGIIVLVVAQHIRIEHRITKLEGKINFIIDHLDISLGHLRRLYDEESCN